MEKTDSLSIWFGIRECGTARTHSLLTRPANVNSLFSAAHSLETVASTRCKFLTWIVAPAETAESSSSGRISVTCPPGKMPVIVQRLLGVPDGGGGEMLLRSRPRRSREARENNGENLSGWPFTRRGLYPQYSSIKAAGEVDPSRNGKKSLLQIGPESTIAWALHGTSTSHNELREGVYVEK